MTRTELIAQTIGEARRCGWVPWRCARLAEVPADLGAGWGCAWGAGWWTDAELAQTVLSTARGGVPVVQFGRWEESLFVPSCLVYFPATESELEAALRAAGGVA